MADPADDFESALDDLYDRLGDLGIYASRMADDELTKLVDAAVIAMERVDATAPDGGFWEADGSVN